MIKHSNNRPIFLFIISFFLIGEAPSNRFISNLNSFIYKKNQGIIHLLVVVNKNKNRIPKIKKFEEKYIKNKIVIKNPKQDNTSHRSSFNNKLRSQVISTFILIQHTYSIHRFNMKNGLQSLQQFIYI